jgi:hypothetical protein
VGKNDGKGDAIYGGIPDAGVDAVVKEAMADLNESESNKVNGPLKGKDTEYPEE